MTESDRRDPDAEAPGTPVSRLSAAVLRISASLDLDTVLREVVESARALTGARLGVIATVDEGGLAQGHVASGLASEEARQMAARPDAMRLFATRIRVAGSLTRERSGRHRAPGSRHHPNVPRPCISEEPRMKKSDLSSRLATEMSLSKAQASGVVDAVFSAIADALARDESVAIAGLGTFSTKTRGARQGRNPRTGESIEIAASKSPSFKAGKTLRGAVRG